MMEFNADFSRRVLLRLWLAVGLSILGLAASLDFVKRLYFDQQLTGAGYTVSGVILAMFLAGLVNLVLNLVRYSREEQALSRFIKALEGDVYTSVESVSPRALIQQRLRAIQKLAKLNAPINHNALAATLVANESTRLGFAKFVNNVLILMGVFGTMVSLALALFGASKMLEPGHEMSHMQLILHGMSTAPNTTLTAIATYFFFAYFYLKVMDARTHLLAGIEQVTALYLLPKYGPSADNLLQDVAGLARNLRQVSEAMQVAGNELTQATRALREMMDAASRRVTPLTDDVIAIRRLLREGFRLPEGQ